MRLIDADALWIEMQKEYTNGDCADKDRYNLGINVGITKCYNLIKNAPTVKGEQNEQ